MSTTFRTGTLALAVGLALGTSPSFAAGFETVAEKKGSVERIAVLGSRSAPRSVAESPVPIDIISGDELGKNASSDMLDMLVGAIPSLNARAQPISDAASLIRPVNLRGLPSDSTLVLLNGKRRHRASVIAFQGGGINDGAQGPDISVIPSVAIKQIEVLRDGAAAQYGSDAIAGVMNFVLKDDADGGSISVRQGSYYEGDGDSTVVDGNVGLPFMKDGFVNLSFQIKNADATSRSVQRTDAQSIAEAGNTAIENPAQIWGNPEVKDDITLFGNLGLDLGDDKAFYMFGNYSKRDVAGGFYYRNPHNRDNVFSIDGGETLLVGDVGLATTGVPSCSWSNATADDPLVSSNVSANVPNVLDTADYQAMVADTNCFSMNQIMPGGYTPQFGGKIIDTSLTVGTKGEINSGVLKDWIFDVSGSLGRNESKFNLKNTLNPSLGLDTPVNFNTGSYIQMEKTFNFDLVKGIEMGLGRPVNVAMGLEWREESFDIISGEEASWKAGAYADQGFNIGSHGFKGFGPETQGRNDRRNAAAYVDVEAHLTESLLVGAAIRHESFNSFGSTTNYKLTAQLIMSEEISIRGSHSTGFRAPTVGQANVTNTQTSIVGGNLIQSFLAPPTNILSAFYGGKELTPEESKSFALGGVYQHGNFLFTLDYYNIEVIDRLTQSSQVSVLAENHAQLAALGVVNPELISAVTYFTNDFDTTTQGVDVVANYTMALLGGNTVLSLAYNWTDTSVDKFNVATTDIGKVRRLEEGIPENRATVTIAQNWENITSFVRVNYFGEYFATHADDTCAEPECLNETGASAVTIDAEVSYLLNDSITLSAGANNIFDQEAQKLSENSSGEFGAQYYESGAFDYNGGYYYVKATYNF
tara:strand:+ start:6786 stop:9395 length:2610 start_codon:yes stop_codon:yes gene_type:complete